MIRTRPSRTRRMLGERRRQLVTVNDTRRTRALSWSDVDFVVGVRENLLPPGHTRQCPGCDANVFTSLAYPADVVVLCASCALAELEPDVDADAQMDDP